MLIVWGEANGALCPVLGRLRAGHYHDGDHHRRGSGHRLGIHLQKVSSFSSELPARRGEGYTKWSRIPLWHSHPKRK